MSYKRLLLLLPAWVCLALATFTPSRADMCTSVEGYDKKRDEHYYIVTCDLTGSQAPTAPVVDPSPSPTKVSLSPSDASSPTKLPTTTAPTPSPDITNSAPSQTPTDNVISTTIPDPVVLDNGVIVSSAVAEDIEVLKNPTQLLSAAIVNPKKVFKALSNVGADMTPKTRKRSQEVVVSAIIAVQIVSGTVTTLIRKP